MNLTLKSYIEWVKNNKFTPWEVIKNYLEKAQEKNKELKAFVRFHPEYVDENLDNFADKPLCGAPIGIKDLINTKWYITSGGSRILENYISPYTATCIINLENNGWLMIGKTNCDQFGMGSSTENSYFGNTLNPYGKDRVPGWSSWWSAAAVAADMCIAALGTDTGGSSRQPAALCNVVGLKPTYGRVSRYGVMAYASSFDQVGTFTKTVEDAKILLSSICWLDKKDSQSDPRSDEKNWDVCFENIDITKYKIAIPKQFLWEWMEENIRIAFTNLIEWLRSNEITVDEVDMPILNNVLSIYYTLVPAEVSTNLSRLDGIKYGLQDNTMNHPKLSEYYSNVRSQWFGDEAKRRILAGTFVLSSDNYEGYYLKAKKARIKLRQEFDKLYNDYDLVMSPTSPEVAWKFGEKSDDPLKMYLADIYTVTANLIGSPAISVPAWFVSDRGEDMPWWVQFMAQRRREDNLFSVGNWIEKNFK